MSECRTPETVPIIEGENLITTIHHYNVAENLNLAYHGGKIALQTLRTSMPLWLRDGMCYEDSESPIVCTLDTPLVPVFYSLAQRGYREYSAKEGGGVQLMVRRDKAEQFYAAEGFVAVVALDESFTLFQGGQPVGLPGESIPRVPELRSPLDQTPLFNVKVSFNDFLQLLADDPKSSFEFFT